MNHNIFWAKYNALSIESVKKELMKNYMLGLKSSEFVPMDGGPKGTWMSHRARDQTRLVTYVHLELSAVLRT